MNPNDLRGLILRELESEVECEALDGRILCNMPLTYPDGDSVTVYVAERDGQFEVTDYSEGMRLILSRPNLFPSAIHAYADAICRSLDVHYTSGRVSGLAGVEGIADTIWRVTIASSRIAEASTYLRVRKYRASKFTQEVHAALTYRHVEVQSGHRVQGASGHNHRVSFFIPKRNALLEPIGSEGAWAQASAVYVKFADVSQTNGYKFLSVLDDREQSPEQDVTNLLLQVSVVMLWSHRDEWLGQVV